MGDSIVVARMPLAIRRGCRCPVQRSGAGVRRGGWYDFVQASERSDGALSIWEGYAEVLEVWS